MAELRSCHRDRMVRMPERKQVRMPERKQYWQNPDYQWYSAAPPPLPSAFSPCFAPFGPPKAAEKIVAFFGQISKANGLKSGDLGVLSFSPLVRSFLKQGESRGIPLVPFTNTSLIRNLTLLPGGTTLKVIFLWS